MYSTFRFSVAAHIAKQSTLTNARFTRHQHKAAQHDATAQNPVQLCILGVDVFLLYFSHRLLQWSFVFVFIISIVFPAFLFTAFVHHSLLQKCSIVYKTALLTISHFHNHNSDRRMLFYFAHNNKDINECKPKGSFLCLFFYVTGLATYPFSLASHSSTDEFIIILSGND